MPKLELQKVATSSCDTAQENLDSLANPCDPEQIKQYLQTLRAEAAARQQAGIDPDDLKAFQNRLNVSSAGSNNSANSQQSYRQGDTEPVTEFSAVQITGASINVQTDANFTPTKIEGGVGVGAAAGILPNGKISLLGIPIGYTYSSEKEVDTSHPETETLENKPNARAAYETKTPEEAEKLLTDVQGKFQDAQAKYTALNERTSQVIEESTFTGDNTTWTKHYEAINEAAAARDDLELAIKILHNRLEKQGKTQS
ncbi:MAG: hypothetical protein PHC51_12695 [bacterium]|nr:hypothetical protein [bacterium]